MSEQRQFDNSDNAQRPKSASNDGTDGAGRLAEVRAEFDQLFAAAEATLNNIRTADSAWFLEQVRQSGGE